MAIFTVTNGEANNLAVVKVTPQEFECFTLYEYIITANQGDSITITVNGNDFESKYINNSVEQTFSDSATVSFNSTLSVSFLLLNSGVQGVFPNATIRIDNNTTAVFYENFVERQNDEANCYNASSTVTSTSQLLNDGETGTSTYVEQTDLDLYLPLAGGTMTGNISGGGFELQNFSRLDIAAGGNTMINNWTSGDTIYRLGLVAGQQLQYNQPGDEWRIDGSKIMTPANALASDSAFSSYLTITAANVQLAIQELKDEVDAIVASSGSGDMLKATYDTGDNGIVDNSEALEGLTASQFLRSDIADIADARINFEAGVAIRTVGITANVTLNTLDPIPGSSDSGLQIDFGAEDTVSIRNNGFVRMWDFRSTGELDGATGTSVTTDTVTVLDEAYGVSWNGSLEVPTKNAVYDQIEAISVGGGTAWGGITGTLSNQTDLQTALDLKLDASTYTAADVLAKLVTVDGPGSGISADTLDGIDSTGFIRNTLVSGQTVTGVVSDLNNAGTGLFYANSGATNKPDNTDSFGISLDFTGSAAQLAMRNNQIWFRTEEASSWGSWNELFHAGNTGSSPFVLSAGDTMTGDLIIDNGATVENIQVENGFISAKRDGDLWRTILGSSSTADNFLVGGSTTGDTTTLDTFLRIRPIASGDLLFQENSNSHLVYHAGNTASAPFVVETGDTMTGTLTFNSGGNIGLLTAADSQRLLIGGGTNWSTSNGAYISIEGEDFGGVGSGGSINFELPGSGTVNSNQSLIVNSSSIVQDNGTAFGAVISRREVGGFDYDSRLSINGGNGGALWNWINGNGTDTFLEQNGTLRWHNGTGYVWTLSSTGAVSQDGTLTIAGTEYTNDDINVNGGATAFSFLNSGSALPINTNTLVVSSNYGAGRGFVPTNGIYSLSNILTHGELQSGNSGTSDGGIRINKSDTGQMLTAWEDNFYRWRLGGGGTVAGWRWDNFDTIVATLTNGGEFTTNAVLVDDDAYDSGWNGNLRVPTRNAVYDQLESLTSEATGSSGMVLEGSTSGTYTISAQSWGWYRYGKMVTFYIGLSNVNGSTPLGNLRIDTSGTSLPAITGTNVYAVESNDIGNAFYSIHAINIGSNILEFRIQTALDSSNQTAVVNANFSGSQDIFVSGSYITV